MTLTDHHWSSHPTTPPSSATPPMIMDHHHHHQQQSSLDSCSSSPGQTSLTSSHSSTSYAMTDMTNHSSCSSESFLNSMSFLERKPYRPFRSNEEYLIAMKEDLAEWLNTLYSLDLNCENFLQRLETGVILCQHANSVLRKAREWRLLNSATGSNSVSTSGYVSSSQSFNSSCSLINAGGDNSIISIGWSTGNDVSLLDRRELVPVKINALPGTFQARDNVANFIEWCRRIHIHECLLFETEDLVGRKNEKSFVLCLLEVARYGAKFGVLAPTLVQFEQEIDREIENDQQQQQHQSPKRSQVTSQDCRIRLPTKMISNNSHQEEDPVSYQDDGPQQQITNNDLESLHEKVVNLLSRCTCPVQFYLEHLSEGKYRIGDTRTLIFVRILRNHVMVRVGGGWDTLEHYLEKHDPCRGRFGHRFSNSARASLNSQGSAVVATNHHQNYHRTSVGSSNVQVASDRPDHQQQHSSNSVYRSTTTFNQLSPLTSRRSMTQNLASTTRISQQSSPQDSLVNGNNSGVSSIRRASTSSNDSHHSFSSSSSTSLLPSGSSMELYTNANSNRTPTPSHSHCHSMTNFVLPDRNNNIKGLATSSNNGSVQNNGAVFNRISSLSSNNNNNNNNKPQVAINKKRTNENFVSSSCSLNNTNTSCIPSTPTSRIPKSKVPTTPNHLRPSGGSASPGRKSSTPLLLTQAHKLKSTSICSLTANGSGNGSRIPTSASSPLSIDHRKLLTNYGLTPARYSSHNIYSACSNNNQQLSGTKAHHHHHQQQQQQQHQSSKSTSSSASPARIQRNRYDKQKLNKSTIDLMSTGRLNESNHSESFYSKIQMPNSNGHCSLMVNHDNKNGKSSKLYQPHNNRRPSSSSSSSSGSLPRTKSTTIIANTPTINGNLTSISSNFIKKSMINGGVQSKIGSSSNAENNKKRLQGSATSLNSAGSTEGGTTTGSSNGSLNESSMGVGHRRLSSPSPTNLVTIGGGGATATAAGAGAKTMPNDRKEEPTNTNTKPPTPLIVGRGHSNTDNKADLVVRATMMGGPIVKPTVKPMVEVCSWLERRQNVLD